MIVRFDWCGTGGRTSKDDIALVEGEVSTRVADYFVDFEVHAAGTVVLPSLVVELELELDAVRIDIFGDEGGDGAEIVLTFAQQPGNAFALR